MPKMFENPFFFGGGGGGGRGKYPLCPVKNVAGNGN